MCAPQTSPAGLRRGRSPVVQPGSLARQSAASSRIGWPGLQVRTFERLKLTLASAEPSAGIGGTAAEPIASTGALPPLRCSLAAARTAT